MRDDSKSTPDATASFTGTPILREIEAHGGLTPSLNIALASAGSRLHANDISWFAPFGPGQVRIAAEIRSRRRMSTVGLAPFPDDLWPTGVSVTLIGNGQMLAHIDPASVRDLVRAIRLWLEDSASLETIASEFPGAQCEESMADPSIDPAPIVRRAWENKALHHPDLRPFIERAVQHPTLRTLFPVTSMDYLRFSRCICFPYTSDIDASVSAHVNHVDRQRIADGTFWAGGRDRAPAVRVGPDEALQIVVDGLPFDVQPAIYGNARDLPY